VRVYQLASDERLPEASTGALAIILVGLIPVYILSRAMSRSRPAAARAAVALDHAELGEVDHGRGLAAGASERDGVVAERDGVPEQEISACTRQRGA
jgi:hypothetical protein